MYRLLGLLSCCVVLSGLEMVATPATSTALADSSVRCAGATTTTTTASGASSTATIEPGSPPSGGGSCWEDVQPYPFGSAGGPVESSSVPNCDDAIGEVTCPLTVTSMAFRARNRGLAATTEQGSNAGATAYGVWIFNGNHWYPSPTFPGSKKCPGNTIVWAGKLDYWLVGPGPEDGNDGKWANLCRFEGEVNLEWEPFALPSATKEHVGERPGGITSAACYAWNDCWFFGTYGTVVHWNGKALTNASPDPLQSLLQGEYTAAAAREGPVGERLGIAVGATSEAYADGPLTTLQGEPPAQLFASSGQAFSPLPFTPYTSPQVDDPYRTDLVAAGIDAAGQGWVAGNPAGLRLEEHREGPSSEGGELVQPVSRPFAPPESPQPSPLLPVSTSGAAAACTGPPTTRFTYTPNYEHIPAAGAFLWSSMAVFPSIGEALAGGKAWEEAAAHEEPAGQPVIAQANCEGTTTLTRFSEGSSAPADRAGGVTAVAANAANDAWAATSAGTSGGPLTASDELPHLYRLTNGEPPEAPEGNEEEPERLKEEEEGAEEEPQPPAAEAPPPPLPPVEAPPIVTRTHAVTLPPAVYDVKAKLHTAKRNGQVYMSLYITFKVRRSVTIGAQAFLHGHVVSEARPRHFVGHTGLLVLSLNRKHWPTKVSFVE
jgi:hypothetical protein